MTPAAAAIGRASDTRLLRRLLRYVFPYKWHVLAVLLLSAFVTIEAAPAYLLHLAIDYALEPVLHGTLPLAVGLRRLDLVTLAYCGVLIVTAIVIYSQVRLTQTIGQRAMADLRHDIFVHLQQLPVSFYDTTPLGRMMTRATTDVAAISQLLSSDAVAMVNDVVLLAIMAAVMISMDWRLAAVTLGMVPVIVVITAQLRRRIRSADRLVRAAITGINVFLQEHLSGIAIVQAFNRQALAVARFDDLNEMYRRSCLGAVKVSALFAAAIETLIYVAIAMLFWLGGGLVLAGSVQVGVLVAFVLYAQRFFRPLQDLREKLDRLQGAMASFEGIASLLDEPVQLPPAVRRRSASIRGDIEFRNVWFRYGATNGHALGKWALRGVSFTVKPGETVAIVGPTGAGKSTAIQLLLRFYDVERGQILLDGVDIREFDPRELRSHFGVVLQDSMLFSGTLESNVLLDRGGGLNAEKALRTVGLGALLDGLPRGVATPVTERGATFSSGQQQLVSFARAIVDDPAVIVLDEATSSVDESTERLIRDALDRICRARAAIIVAHRFSTVQRATRLLVFHKGRVCEQGTHDDLMRLGGTYSKLHRLQHEDDDPATQAFEDRWGLAPASS